MLRPSETAKGQKWLENFPLDDVSTARVLLDSIHIVSETTFKARLTERVIQVAQHSQPPVVLYPLWPDPRKARDSARLAEIKEWVEPDPDRPYERDAGSELIIANLIRDVVRFCRSSGVSISSLSQVEELREQRCRTIIFVDDYIGSGDSVASYCAAWMRNRTIRSWRSLKLINFKLVAFGMSSMARDRLQRHPLITDDIYWVMSGLDFARARWTEKERSDVIDLCRRYSHRKKHALGWSGSAGLVAFAHTVPNNLPSILLQKQGPHRTVWTPFFASRSMSAEQQLELGDTAPALDIAEAASQLGQARLGQALDAMPEGPRRPLLLVLASLARGRKSGERLAEQLGLPLYEVTQYLQWARRFILVDQENRLTDHGWDELRRARSLPRSVILGPRGSSDPYYPRTLRGDR